MLRTVGVVIAVALFVVSCGGGDSSSGVPAVAATPRPQHLQYGVGPGEVGVPFGPYPPSVIGAVTAYSVTPALPAGLTLDPKSGIISGTPQVSSHATYVVTASNDGGSATVALVLAIFVPPTLSYASPVTATLGAALSPQIPTLAGDADTFDVVPPLPDGLAIDPATGIVSGTPTRPRVAVTYTVLASNGGGASTTADLVLGIDPGPVGTAVTGVFRGETVSGLGYRSGAHSGLTDGSGAFTYEVGQSIAFFVGGVSIGSLPTAKELVTPVDLVAGGTGSSNRVVNVVRFLMMLDQDGNPNNGIQISPAVTAAAASWAPVDFDSVDLPASLGALVQQASAADGVMHVLPDAPTAQAHLRTGFYCTRSGLYVGTFAADSSPSGHGNFWARVRPDGSMHSNADNAALSGFDVQTNDALNSALDATFAQSAPQNAVSPAVNLQGYFADATVLKGTYQTDVGGSFQAVADASVDAIYKFYGSITWTPNDPTKGSPYTVALDLGIDRANAVSGGSITGTVSGNAFTGTRRVRVGDGYAAHFVNYPVSGTYANSASGIALDGQYSTPDAVVTFATVGCRAN